MYRAFVLLAILATFASVHANVLVPRTRVPMPDGRIVGGENAEVENFPYQVSVRLLGSHICGGSIYKSRVVVTAAHCIYSVGASYYSVQFGTSNLGTGPVYTAERLLKHEKYDSNVIDYDIALIFLRDEIPFSAISHPINLATEDPAPGTIAVVSGWGTTSEGGISSNKLQKVNVEIVERGRCSKQYSGVNEITDRMVCAGVEAGGKDACQGDSGGPLVANNVLVGVVSWGVGCARQDYSGVYSNVANLRSWILQHTSSEK